MDTDALISSVQSAPEFLHLKKDVVTLPGRNEPYVPARKMLILEQCGLTDGRRGRIEQQVKDNPLHYEFIDPLETYGAARLYADLACISFGDVPTLLEFVAMLPADTGAWLEKAIQVNPAMFAWIMEMAKTLEQMDAEYLKSIAPDKFQAVTDEGEKELVKKKVRTRRKSTVG